MEVSTHGQAMQAALPGSILTVWGGTHTRWARSPAQHQARGTAWAWQQLQGCLPCSTSPLCISSCCGEGGNLTLLPIVVKQAAVKYVDPPRTRHAGQRAEDCSWDQQTSHKYLLEEKILVLLSGKRDFVAGGKSQERLRQRTMPRPQSRHHIPFPSEGVGVFLTASLRTSPSPLLMDPTAAGTIFPEPAVAKEMAGPQPPLAWSAGTQQAPRTLLVGPVVFHPPSGPDSDHQDRSAQQPALLLQQRAML